MPRREKPSTSKRKRSIGEGDDAPMEMRPKRSSRPISNPDDLIDLWVNQDEEDFSSFEDSDYNPETDEEKFPDTDSEQSMDENASDEILPEFPVPPIQENEVLPELPVPPVQENEVRPELPMPLIQEDVCELSNEGQETIEPPIAAESDGTIERQNAYYGKNRFKWSPQEFYRTTRTLLHNIIRMSSKLGPKIFSTYEELFSLLFTDNMISKIVTHTNKKIESYQANFKNTSRIELMPTTILEMKAFIGLLYYTSVFKSNRENADYIYATDGTGREIFRCVMSRNRFLVLNYCLRFDDSESRPQRLQDDKLAAISELFNEFVSNCQKNYTLGTYICIDEMLVPFRGRCKFIIYMPSKPAKYGLKLLMLVDAKTFYIYNIYIYHGKGSDSLTLTDEEKKFGIPTQSVVRLCKGLEGSHRNLTADNWFSSIELMNILRDNGLTYLGTLKKNKREIPPEFQPSRERCVGTSLYGFTKDATIVSYVPKPKKAVILISSMHHKKETDEETGKPAMIIDYNKTKGGVDEVDKKCSNYSSSRRTQRWPMAIFYRIIDMCGINLYVLYEDCENTKNTTRGIFLQSLARSLVLPQMMCRVYNDRLPRELRLTLERVIGQKDMPPRLPSPPRDTTSNSRKTCAICPSRMKRRTRFACYVCLKPLCLTCCHQICSECKIAH